MSLRVNFNVSNMELVRFMVGLRLQNPLRNSIMPYFILIVYEKRIDERLRLRRKYKIFIVLELPILNIKL